MLEAHGTESDPKFEYGNMYSFQLDNDQTCWVTVRKQGAAGCAIHIFIPEQGQLTEPLHTIDHQESLGSINRGVIKHLIESQKDIILTEAEQYKDVKIAEALAPSPTEASGILIESGKTYEFTTKKPDGQPVSVSYFLVPPAATELMPAPRAMIEDPFSLEPEPLPSPDAANPLARQQIKYSTDNGYTYRVLDFVRIEEISQSALEHVLISLVTAYPEL